MNNIYLTCTLIPNNKPLNNSLKKFRQKEKNLLMKFLALRVLINLIKCNQSVYKNEDKKVLDKKMTKEVLINIINNCI